MSNKWIGVDLDGTLAFYDQWRGPGHIGEPIPLMLERVKEWIAKGITVKIFTARVSDKNQAQTVREAMAVWCVRNGLPVLEVVCCKDFAMIELWDDRAVAVKMNTGIRIGAQP